MPTSSNLPDSWRVQDREALKILAEEAGLTEAEYCRQVEDTFLSLHWTSNCLTFRELETLSLLGKPLDPERQAHVHTCVFCAGLIDTIGHHDADA